MFGGYHMKKTKRKLWGILKNRKPITMDILLFKMFQEQWMKIYHYRELSNYIQKNCRQFFMFRFMITIISCFMMGETHRLRTYAKFKTKLDDIISPQAFILGTPPHWGFTQHKQKWAMLGFEPMLSGYHENMISTNSNFQNRF